MEAVGVSPDSVPVGIAGYVGLGLGHCSSLVVEPVAALVVVTSALCPVVDAPDAGLAPVHPVYPVGLQESHHPHIVQSDLPYPLLASYLRPCLLLPM